MMDTEKMQVVDISEPSPIKEIAEMISKFRRDYLQGLFDDVAQEADEVAKSEYDPAKGTGRGPWWANGG